MPKTKNKNSKELLLSDASLIEFVPLYVRSEPDGRYLVGVEGTNKSFHVGGDIGPMLPILLHYGNIKTAAHLIKKQHPRFTISDIRAYLRGMIKQCINLGLIKSIDGKELPSPTTQTTKPSLFSLAKVAFGVFLGAGILYDALAVYLIFSNPSYFPRATDLFWHTSYAVSIFTAFALSWLFLLKHELAHLLTAKVLGADGDISLSRRLYFLVAETKIVNAFKLKKYQRIFMYLAGILSDLLVFAVGIWLVWLHDLEIWSLAPGMYLLIKQIILLEWMSMLWQGMFFMRTDIYFVFTEFFNCDNLLENSQRLARNIGLMVIKIFYPQIKHKKISLSTIQPNELKIARFYVWFLIAGTGIALAKWLCYDWPILFTAVWAGIQLLAQGVMAGNVQYIVEALVILSIKGFHETLLVFVWLKSKKLT